jgi:uncharacterized protein (TIGR03066 family)
MRYLTGLVAIGLVVSFAQAADAASEKQLVGKWLVLKFEKSGKTHTPPPTVRIEMQFTKAHRWVGTFSQKGRPPQEKKGKWTLEGDKLTTSTDGRKKKETVAITITGDSMVASKKGGSEKLYFKRIK